MGTVVTCSGVSKCFRIPMHEQLTLKGRLFHPFTRGKFREFDALRDVSFAVEEGEFFGIVGRNGSGKSTLLKILAGIYGADTGHINVEGTLAPFIELGVGFNFELSGRDNVFLNGALLGLTKRQLRERYDHIVEFAELEDFMDLKLANFSSGMQVRLAFAIAVESDADILLIDEVLAVGDERFQRKCFDVFRARKAAGKTVIFVSHDMGAVKEFCDRVLLLERGEMVECADARTIAQSYYRLNLPDHADKRNLEYGQGWFNDVALEPRVLDETATVPVHVVQHGERIRLSARITARDAIASPSYGFIVYTPRGRNVIAVNTNYQPQPPPPVAAGEEIQVSFEFDNHLGAGDYYVKATLESNELDDPLDIVREVIHFRVESEQPTGALLEVPQQFTLKSAQPAKA